MPIPLQIRDTNFLYHKVGGHDELFQISEEDTSGDPRYYGYISASGYWIIIEENSAAGTYRYAGGSSDYATNWTGRAGLSYDYYNELFS